MLGFVFAFLGVFLTTTAQAQTGTPDVSRELRLIESTERGLDPLGLDESTGKQLDEAAEQLEASRKRSAAPRPPLPVRGEVLTSVEGVQEVAHSVQVRLAEGLAFVRVEARFESRSKDPAEVAYRLPLPSGAATYEARICQGSRCAELIPSRDDLEARATSADAPSGEAEMITDAHGSALALRLSSARKGTALSFHVDYVAAAEVHAGKVRFRLPARGYDARIVPGEVSVVAPALAEVSPVGSVMQEPNLALEIQAQLDAKRPPLRALTRSTCGGKPCSRRFETASVAPLTARETWLLLDASPSMQGPARNAADTALVGLLALLPEETPLRAFAFGAQAKELGSFRAGSAPLALLSDALSADLGGASRPALALALAKAELAHTRPRVLLLSDGKLDKAAVQELSNLRRHAAELWWIALSDAPSLLEPHCDGVVRLAASLADERSEELLHAALSPLAKTGLRSGEQRVHEVVPKGPYLPLAHEGWLSFWSARTRPLRFRTPEAPASTVIRAPGFSAMPRLEQAADTGMPKESVLSMLRNQLIPQARACLRSDRKGRGDYAVALTFHALFADREAYDVRVEGRIPDALRQCLRELVPKLRIPAFTGRIRVRYPIHTEREPESPMIELEPDALEQVDRVIRGK